MFYRLRAAYLIWRVTSLDRALRRAKRAVWRLADKWPPLMRQLNNERTKRREIKRGRDVAKSINKAVAEDIAEDGPVDPAVRSRFRLDRDRDGGGTAC